MGEVALVILGEPEMRKGLTQPAADMGTCRL
jgi:hypothetical protein